MNFQTSRRFVSSSNPPLSSPALILRTLFSPWAGHRTAPECCRLLQSSCRSCTSPLQRAAVTGCSAAVPHLTCRTPELAVVVFWLSFTTAEIWLTEINVRIDKYPYALLITFDLKNVFNVTKFCLTINSSPFTKLTLSMSEATFHLLMKCQMNMAFGFMTPPMTSQGRWAVAWCQCDCVEEAEWGYHGDEETGACHHYTLSISGHRWTTDSWTILLLYWPGAGSMHSLVCSHPNELHTPWTCSALTCTLSSNLAS